jgi:formate dehydrogenase assembly factor FdhD
VWVQKPGKLLFPFSRDVSLSKNALYTMGETFNEQSNLFHITGAVHAMALTDGNQILLLNEDVARYNGQGKGKDADTAYQARREVLRLVAD